MLTLGSLKFRLIGSSVVRRARDDVAKEAVGATEDYQGYVVVVDALCR